MNSKFDDIYKNMIPKDNIEDALIFQNNAVD